MIRPQVQFNLAVAKSYFREHLSTGDYYSEGQTIHGEWFGQGAAKLALAGHVSERAFLALCDGKHPETDCRLTQRMKTIRRQDGQESLNRRVFYDFTISPPKSVSIVGLYQDPRIVELHNRAVRMAMTQLEKLSETRVRKSGMNEDRITGNLVGASFRHDTSRELDPHLHTHCVVFNATFDPQEGRWKALQAEAMYRAVSFAQEYYRHELAKGLRAIGYEIDNNLRGFEIRAVPQSLVARFSKRHQQIDQDTKTQVECHGFKGDIKALRNRIAHSNRRRKMKGVSSTDFLKSLWRTQMTPDERQALGRLESLPTRTFEKPDLHYAVDWAEQHVFDRRATVQDHEILAAALGVIRGRNFELADLAEAVAKKGFVREAGTNRITSREVLGRELDLVVAAKEGRFRYTPLGPEHAPSLSLSDEQAGAVRKILASRDFITLFRGAAGTGKSLTLAEIDRGLRAAGHPVVVLPAQTVAQVLTTKQLPTGVIIICDEAGQIAGRDLHALVSLVRANRGRLILSGDTRQHGAVGASDALRAIERHAGLQPAEITQIRRQDPALGRTVPERHFIRGYRAAVRDAALGKIAQSFDRLDSLGCVQEFALDERRSVLAGEYAAAIGRSEKALVVAQTWDEVDAVNDAIREVLRSQGKIGDGVALEAFRVADLDSAQKKDVRSYQPGQHAFFLKGYGRFAKGDLCEIRGANESGVVLRKNGRQSTISFRYTDRVLVARAATMEVGPGDRLQLKFNGKSQEGLALANGELVTVRQIGTDGSLAVESDAGLLKTLTPSQRLFNRGFATTSYASQGKTVDTVLLSDSGRTPATNANQWYVSISRARRKVLIFTGNKAELRAQIHKSGDRGLALDLFPADSTVNVSGTTKSTAFPLESYRLRPRDPIHVMGASDASQSIRGSSHRF
jgi:conjugative relaxase-like TrwC/TraI family protein